MNSIKKTLDHLYKYWAFCCPFIAFFIMATSLTFANFYSLPTLAWLQLAIYCIHQWEEHWYPGGFKTFINKEIFKNTNTEIPLNDKSIFFINVVGVWLLFTVCIWLGVFYNNAFLLIPPIFSIFNGIIHSIAAFIKQAWNPGTYASIFLNIPGGIWMLWVADFQGVLNHFNVILSLFFTFLCHIPIAIQALRIHQKHKLTK